MDKALHGAQRILDKPSSVHLRCSDTSLLLPRVIIGVKDAIAEQLSKPLPVVLALREVLELSLENVFDLNRVRGHNALKPTKQPPNPITPPTFVQSLGIPIMHFMIMEYK
uniref:Uncharacterized protein n=1 Tax=Opuntia streptacantha TaxID=393608 RepID=A0A7C9ANB9_OPUST